MDTEKIYTGTVASFKHKMSYGFIKTESGESYFFFHNNRKEAQKKRQEDPEVRGHKFTMGDVVEFQVRTSEKDSNKVEAWNLNFIKNPKRDELTEAVKENNTLEGLLTVDSKGEYIIKHATTHITLPVFVSEWEIDLDAIYANRKGLIVPYKLTEARRKNEFRAVLSDTVFCPEYYLVKDLMESSEPIPAVLTRKTEFGFHATILDGKVTAYISKIKEATAEEIERFTTLNEGDEVKGVIIYIQNNKHVKLRLAE